jgi:hypothetical protein
LTWEMILVHISRWFEIEILAFLILRKLIL